MMLNPWVSLWIVGGVFWFAITGILYLLERDEPKAFESVDSRTWARMVLATPIWPIVLTVVAVRGTGRMFRHATYQDREETR